MAIDKDIPFNVDINTGDAGKSLLDLKKEFKELQKELSATKTGTVEYQKTLEKLGKTKDEIGDLRDTINALNPEGKVVAFAKVGSTIASGFAAAQGAAALFGTKNEALEKSLLKVQAAMALSEGIKGIVGAGDAFEVLNAVMKANPILAIVAGFTLLVGASIAVYNEFFKLDSASESLSKKLAQVDEENKHITASIKAQITALSGLKSNEGQILELKEKGFKLDIERQKIALQVALAKQFEAEAEFNYNEQALRFAGKDKEADVLKLIRTKEQRDASQLAIEALRQSISGLAEFHNTQEQKKLDVSEAATKKEIELAKKKADEQKKYLQEQYDFHKKIQQQILDDLHAENVANRKLLEEKKEADDTLNDDETTQFLAISDAKNKKKKEDAEADKKLNQETEQAKAESIRKGLQAAQALTDLFFSHQLKMAKGNADREREIKKKQFNVNKAFGVAGSIIDGVGAIQKALNNPYPLNIVLAVLTGILATANTIKIATAKFDDGGGSSGSSGDIGGGAGIGTAPVIPSPNNTTTKLNDDGTKADKVGQPIVIKNEIVETQVTDNQNRVAKIKESATYG